MVGNFDVDVEQQQRIGHLLSPSTLKCETILLLWIVFMLMPGWDFPKLNPNDHYQSFWSCQRLSFGMLE